MVHPLGSVLAIGVIAGALAFGVSGSGSAPDAVGPRPGAVVDPRPGAVVDPRPGAVVDPRPGAVVDPGPGTAVDPRPGTAVGPRPGTAVDNPTGADSGARSDVPGSRTGDEVLAPTARDDSGYALPLAGGPAIVRPFDAPDGPWAPGHRGVDLAGAAGRDVLAPAAGTVSFAGTVVDRGVVTLVHADGLRSSLEPVSWSVRPGTRVRRGQVVGTIQDVAGHCAPASCLHWGVRRGDVYVDPLSLLPGAGPVILLPDR